MYRLNIFALLSVSILCLNSCQRFDETLIPIELLQGSPTGGVANAQQIGVNGDLVTLKLQVFAVNHFGNFIEGLTPADFRNTGSITASGLTNFQCVQLSQDAPSSVGMLFDHSGSISQTDPNDARIQAGVEFSELIKNSDEACVHYFNDDLNEIISYTNDQSDIEDAIVELSIGEGGGTALYGSLLDLIPSVASGGNFHRAIILFTDGNAGDTGYFNQTLDLAITSNVKIVAVALDETGGLTTSNQAYLTELAVSTGGAFIEADNVTEVISAYQSMGQFLLGSSIVYEFDVTVEKANDEDWNSGDLVQFELFVDLIDGSLINMPVYYTVE